MTSIKLSDDGHCFVCGKFNDYGLGLSVDSDGGRASLKYVGKKIHQGFKDIIHGGIISAILDEAMIKAVLSLGVTAVTAEITVRIKQPLRVGETAIIDAEVSKTRKGLIETTAVMKKGDHTVLAVAKAKLIRNV